MAPPVSSVFLITNTPKLAEVLIPEPPTSVKLSRGGFVKTVRGDIESPFLHHEADRDVSKFNIQNQLQ